MGIAFFWDEIGKMNSFPLFDPLFYHFLAKLKPIALGGLENRYPKVKPIASGGLENRNPRPKYLGCFKGWAREP